MSQHYPRDTVQVSAWCKACWKDTMHRVDDRRLGPCLECMTKQEQKSAELKAQPAQPKQEKLF